MSKTGKPCNYLVFGARHREELGGWDDLRGSAPTLTGARALGKALDKDVDWQWWHIVDLASRAIVWCRYYKHERGVGVAGDGQ
jgi:hypothetical protein